MLYLVQITTFPFLVLQLDSQRLDSCYHVGYDRWSGGAAGGQEGGGGGLQQQEPAQLPGGDQVHPDQGGEVGGVRHSDRHPGEHQLDSNQGCHSDQDVL